MEVRKEDDVFPKEFCKSDEKAMLFFFSGIKLFSFLFFSSPFVVFMIFLVLSGLSKCGCGCDLR